MGCRQCYGDWMENNVKLTVPITEREAAIYRQSAVNDGRSLAGWVRKTLRNAAIGQCEKCGAIYPLNANCGNPACNGRVAYVG